MLCLFNKIVTIDKFAERMTKVVFLGPTGTYSHQAALQQFPEDEGVEHVPTLSIPECFNRLQKDNEIDYAVVPLENSTNGQVVFTYDLLRDWMIEGEPSQDNRVDPAFEIVGEQYVAIEHCLISPKYLSPEDLATTDISRIYSHPQVWGQVANCMQSLSSICGNKLKKIDTSSTSNAVEMCMEDYKRDPSTMSLSIASKTAAKLNNAHIVEHSINDFKGNTTRFLILKRRSTQCTTLDAAPSTKDHRKVTLITFTVKYDDPGSLVDVLMVLKQHGVNMCSINSRPFNNGNERKWQYIFFIEYYHEEGKLWDQVYSEIGLRCSKWCNWGTFYRNGRYYQ